MGGSFQSTPRLVGTGVHFNLGVVVITLKESMHFNTEYFTPEHFSSALGFISFLKRPHTLTLYIYTLGNSRCVNIGSEVLFKSALSASPLV